MEKNKLLAHWEWELINGNRVTGQIRSRIREIEDEINAAYQMIGHATVDGDDVTDWVNGVREKRARVAELKNVLSMMGV